MDVQDIDRVNVIRIIALGNSNVGKTSVIYRYLSMNYKGEAYKPTVGVIFERKCIVLDGDSYILQLWDTAGQERYHSLSTSYCRNAEAVALFYSVVDRSSFESINGWYDKIRDSTFSTLPMILVGNKEDLTGERCVSFDEGRELGEELGIEFIETSAVSGRGVEEMFLSLVNMVRRDRGLLPDPTPPTVSLTEGETEGKCVESSTEKSCC